MNSSRIIQNNVFSIISWNIQGLKTRLKPTQQTISNTKLNIKSIKSNLSKFDIICLQETWAKDESLTFQDYIVHSTVRNTISKRGQAGVSVLIKNKHSDFVSHIKSDSPNITWCQLKRQLLGIQPDIYLAAIYLPPLQSQRKAGEDILNILEREIHKYSVQGQIVLLGDLNARTGTLNDFIEHDCQDFLVIPDTYNLDKNWPKRNNADYTVNKLGGEILQLCIANKLRILNGRVTGDLDGKLTLYQSTGASTVDYGIVSEDLQNTILGFQVQPLTPYSDYCPITLKLNSFCRNSISSCITSKETQRKEAPTRNIITKFLWKRDSKDKFISALTSLDFQERLQSFNTQQFHSIDDEISQFNQILTSVAKCSLVATRKARKNSKKNKPCYDNNCRQLKKKLQNLAKKMNPTTHQSLRQEYFTIKKKYKRLVKKMHKEYKNNILTEINTLSSKHSQDFWKKINKIRNLKTVEESCDIAPEDWTNHFRNLLYESHESEANGNLENNLNETPTLSKHSLDTPITAKEIHDYISKLKTKKSSGTDSILNEMIKHRRYFLVSSLERIFNNIFQNRTFPVEWNIGVIKPIYKNKGDNKSPANYTGITLTSCLGKLFHVTKV